MKPRLMIGGLHLFAMLIALLLAVGAVFVASPSVADRAAEFLGQEKLSFLVRHLY